MTLHSRLLTLTLLTIALLSFFSCNDRNTPSVGDPATDTPVVGPTNPDEPTNPANAMSITVTRLGELMYEFNVVSSIGTSSSIVKWDIQDPDNTETSITNMDRTLRRTFNKAGTARICVTLYNDDNSGGLIEAASQTITPTVY